VYSGGGVGVSIRKTLAVPDGWVVSRQTGSISSAFE